MNAPKKILIVDDEPVNVKVIQRKLEKEGYEVFMASNGAECLELVKENRPDIVLLDIMMPEMDGIETCRRLKEDPKTESIPVIFVTAKMDRSDKVSGLDIGAIDYITKPIDMEETLARVRTHLRLESMHRENIELQQRLGEARRTAAIGSMTQGIAHNLNNLLGVVVGYLDLLKLRMNQPDKLDSGIASMEKAVKRMVDLVRQLSSMVNEGPVSRIKTNPVECVRNVIQRTTRNAKEGHDTVEIESHLPENFNVHISLETVETCLQHLIRNAIESYPEGTPAEERSVTVLLDLVEEGSGQELEIRVVDRGAGISPSVKDNLFDPFISTKNSVGRGFGLTIVKHAMSNISGGISIAPNRSGEGTCATLRIPVEQRDE